MRIRMCMAAFAAFACMGGNAWAAAFSGLYTFGDSLSDAGSSPSAVMSLYKALNNNCDPTHPCAPFGPYFEGRISNGPVGAEYLAERLFPAAVTPANFHSYAFAGATSGSGNFGDPGGSATEQGALKLPGIKPQLDRYMQASGGTADPGALYFVWGGANDYLTHNSPVDAATNISGYVRTLAEAGARHFLVPNLADLGHTPFARREGEAAQARDYTLVFNNELASQLGDVGSSFSGVQITRFDAFSLLNDIVQNPVNYGLADVEGPCVTRLIFECGNPDGHLYWDEFHPTTHVHSILGSAFASAVPEPGSHAMFVAGLIVLGVFRVSTGRLTAVSGVSGVSAMWKIPGRLPSRARTQAMAP